LHGCLISEYPPGTRTLGHHFPVRNRIISGLSLGVLVAEAPQRSGALITASAAREQGRDVFAVPGNLGNPNSEGCNLLIKDGAYIVTGCLDILEQYRPFFQHKIRLSVSHDAASAPAHTPPEPAPARSRPDRASELGRIREKIKGFTESRQAIILTIADGKEHVDEIIEITGLQAHQVLSELTLLEVEGFVRQNGGKRFEVCMD